MQYFVTILHIFLSFALILIILLQPAKDGASVLGGGGGNQNYGPRGQAHVLGRATTVVAALFMVTSITLAFYGSRRAREGSHIEDELQRLSSEEEGGIPMPTAAAPAPEASGDAAAPVEAPAGGAAAAPDEAAPAGEAPTENAAPSQQDDEPTPAGANP